MKTQEIRHRWTNAVLFSTEVEDDDPSPMRTAVTRAYLTGANLAGAYLTGANLAGAYLTGANLAGAYLAGANLTDANLTGANLTGAYLAGAYLAGANLTGANLTGAYLTGANLTDANLTRANLTGANLTGANLTRANLTGAYLTGAYLAGANLTGANLTGAYLTGANLAGIRDDLRSVLDAAPLEVAGLLAKLRSGEVNGSAYEGACSCLKGTIATLRSCHYESMIGPLAPDSSTPCERWFMGIAVGSTPNNNPVAAITDGWICEWLAERGDGDLISEAAP